MYLKAVYEVESSKQSKIGKLKGQELADNGSL